MKLEQQAILHSRRTYCSDLAGHDSLRRFANVSEIIVAATAILVAATATQMAIQTDQTMVALRTATAVELRTAVVATVEVLVVTRCPTSELV